MADRRGYERRCLEVATEYRLFACGRLSDGRHQRRLGVSHTMAVVEENHCQRRVVCAACSRVVSVSTMTAV